MADGDASPDRSGVRIWYQVVSSPAHSPNFLAALQEHCDAVASPTTTVLVRGTHRGGFADHYAALLHLDGAEILRRAREDLPAAAVDVYAMANSLDPVLAGLRELLDVPVVSFLEVGAFIASVIGDSLGLIAPNDKIALMFGDILRAYRADHRLAGIRSLGFGQITDMDRLFVDREFAAGVLEDIEAQASELVAGGADVLIAMGPLSCLVARERIATLAGAPVIDVYGALVKIAEACGALGAAHGIATSRVRRYRRPPAAQVERAFATIWPARSEAPASSPPDQGSP